MEELTLLRDFALIMIVAGAVTLLFRKFKQPPILGYLIAGLLIGPTGPFISVSDPYTIGLLADLGLVLLLFGLGLEFSWNKIRGIGLTVLVIGVAEILTMLCLGYGLGRLLGWSTMDSLFLGAALHISSSAVIVKVLRDLGKLDQTSSKLIVGILVVEDFAAVIMIAVFSGMATTGTADIGDIGSLILRLVIFVVATLLLGALIVPRIIRFAHQFLSREVLLITALGLAFGMALLGEYLGLSVAVGAFLMGSLIGDSEHSEEVLDAVSPIRDMFAALFFVAIGMLIDLADFRNFLVPALAASAVFIFGKTIANTVATFFAGYNGKTAVQVGMGMPQMGEFSLAIARVGADQGVLLAPLYSVVGVATAFTSFLYPYINRSADTVSGWLGRKAPSFLVTYVSRLAEWLQALRSTLTRDTRAGQKVRTHLKSIVINSLILLVILGIGTFTIQFVEDIASLSHIRTDLIGILFGFVFLIFSVPSLLIIWRGLQGLVDEAAIYLVGRRESARVLRREGLRIVLRDSIVIVLSVFLAMWSIPLILQFLAIGSFALAVPLLIIGVVLFLVVSSIRRIHGQFEETFGRVFLGEDYVSAAQSPKSEIVSPGVLSRLVGLARRFVESFGRRIRRRPHDEIQR